MRQVLEEPRRYESARLKELRPGVYEVTGSGVMEYLSGGGPRGPPQMMGSGPLRGPYRRLELDLPHSRIFISQDDAHGGYPAHIDVITHDKDSRTNVDHSRFGADGKEVFKK